MEVVTQVTLLTCHVGIWNHPVNYNSHVKIDVSGSKDRTSNLKHEQHSYAFFASLHNLSTCEQIQTRTKPCDVLWTLLGMKIVRWEQEMKSRIQRVMRSCPEQLPMIDFEIMGPGRDNISWLWSMHVNALWKVTFLQTCTSFALVYLASLKVSAGPSHTHTTYMNCYHLFGVSLGARLLLLVPGDSGLDK